MEFEMLTDQVAQLDGVLREERVAVSDLRVEPDALAVGGMRLALGKQGLARLCTSVGAPATYLEGIGPAVRAQVLEHHIERGDLGGGQVAVFHREGEIVAVVRAGLQNLKGTQVLRAVGDGIGEAARRLKVHEVEFGDDWFRVDLVSEEVRGEAGPGDVLEAGLRVNHSLVGDHATWVEAFILRLVCTNGMTSRDCVERRAARTRRLPAGSARADELQVAQIRRLAATTWGRLTEKLVAIAGLREERVDVEHLLRRWLEQARLSTGHLMPVLLEAWRLEGGEGTIYGAVNALTRVSTHGGESVPGRMRRMLGGLAGVLAFRRRHLCPRCFSALGETAAVGVA